LWNLQRERDHQGGGREINPVREERITPSFLRRDGGRLDSTRSLIYIILGLEPNQSSMNGRAL
jgi:hypothetical protein